MTQKSILTKCQLSKLLKAIFHCLLHFDYIAYSVNNT